LKKSGTNDDIDSEKVVQMMSSKIDIIASEKGVKMMTLILKKWYK